MSSDNRRQRTSPAGEFENRCPALMDEVDETGGEIAIAEPGRPASRLVPVRERRPLIGMFRDKLRIVGDIMSPSAPAEAWESVSNPDRVLDPDIPSGR